MKKQKNKNILIKSDFSQDPFAQGWEICSLNASPISGGWISGKGETCSRAIIEKGCLQSPVVKVMPFHYYRLRFTVKSAQRGFWFAIFFDKAGNELVTDVSDSVYESDCRQEQEFCIRAHADSVRMCIRFLPINTPIEINAILLEEIGHKDVLDWIDGVVCQLPVYSASFSHEQFVPVTSTLEKLKRGKKLRIVILGDSISNDTSNSIFEVPLMARFPKTSIEIIGSHRSATGMWWFKKENRIKDYVIKYKPDLLIIAGISHGFDVESIKSVVSQVKQSHPCDIIYMNDAVTPLVNMQVGFEKTSPLKIDQKRSLIENFQAEVNKMATKENITFIDTRSIWNACMSCRERAYDWYMRDPTHANTRGKQILGRILLQFFTKASILDTKN